MEEGGRSRCGDWLNKTNIAKDVSRIQIDIGRFKLRGFTFAFKLNLQRNIFLFFKLICLSYWNSKLSHYY